jgi:hypothetical protein
MNQAIQKQDTKKALELAQKLTESEKNLGPEYVGLVESLRNMDLTSKDGQEIVSMFDTIFRIGYHAADTVATSEENPGVAVFTPDKVRRFRHQMAP